MPIFDRPFLQYQIDLLRQVPEIDEIVLSLNYQPRRIEEVFGDGSAPRASSSGTCVEPAAARHGRRHQVRRRRRIAGEPLVVFNGDVFTSVDLAGRHRAAPRAPRRSATIVLTPVENPSAYGLVETDARGQRAARFVEKPSPDQIRCDTINAGIYVLEPDTLDRIPPDTVFSIERGYFPSLIENGETFVAHVYRGYWIDIGTPAKYRQAHRDIMAGRFLAPPFAAQPGTRGRLAGGARRRPARPSRRRASSTPAPSSGAAPGSARTASIGSRCHVGEGAVIDGAILWPDTRVDDDARLGAAIAGPPTATSAATSRSATARCSATSRS